MSKPYNKEMPIVFGKDAGSGAAITPEMLARINAYTLTEIPADQLYARKMLLAHNAIDRDSERFSENILADFARTLPGKALLIGHQWGPPGKGTFFEAQIEEMDLQAARQMTGEEIRLPDGVAKFQALMGWFYTTKTAGKDELLKDIDAGIIRHVSIGFSASNMIKVSNEQTGETLYWEYKGPGEAREGSLVWLGAQPGATITKSLKDGADIDDKKTKKEQKTMKMLFAKLGLGAEATEDQALNALNQKLARLNTLEEVASPLGENATKASVEDLVREAADGKAYRKDLVSKQVKYERLLGRVGDKAEDATNREKQLSSRPLDEIKGDIAYMEKQVREKFTDQAGIEGGDPNASRTDGQRKTFRSKPEGK